MPPRCDSCKWWQSEDDESGECTLTLVSYDVLDYPWSLATASGDGYRDFLETKAAFGCVQHEPSETPA